MRSHLAAAALLASTLLSSSAFAAQVDGASWDAAERFQIRGRLIGVVPDEDSSTNVGGDVKVGNALMPEVDLSYYFSDYISAELIAATSQHSISHSAAGDLGDAWILPPTLTLQYHPLPHNAFSPYIGAGINYSYFYGEDEAAGVSNLDVEGGFGYALQVGADYWLDKNWGVNFDVKKLFLNVDSSMNLGATPVSADIDLDPWIIGAGVSYRF